MFRVRKLADKQHYLFIEDVISDIALTPSQMVYKDDHNIYSSSQDDQLLLWLRSRQASLKQHRTSIVIKSLVELGFALTYQYNSKSEKLTQRDLSFISE